MIKVARELLKIARGLAEYEDATKKLGALVKIKFKGHPWKYDKRAKAWVIRGEDVVHEFYEKEGFESGGEARREISRRLGGKFEGYPVISDTEDSYIWIGLD